jgi:ArsR family transcriptional regulator
MAKRKSERLVEIFKALSNPNRLALFERIRELSAASPEGCAADEDCCVGAIGGGLEMAPSTLSEHLKELKRAGLIEMSKKGRIVCCAVAPRALADLESFSKSAKR